MVSGRRDAAVLLMQHPDGREFRRQFFRQGEGAVGGSVIYYNHFGINDSQRGNDASHTCGKRLLRIEDWNDDGKFHFVL